MSFKRYSKVVSHFGYIIYLAVQLTTLKAMDHTIESRSSLPAKCHNVGQITCLSLRWRLILKTHSHLQHHISFIFLKGCILLRSEKWRDLNNYLKIKIINGRKKNFIPTKLFIWNLQGNKSLGRLKRGLEQAYNIKID
jgi:hypothetical protein